MKGAIQRLTSIQNDFFRARATIINERRAKGPAFHHDGPQIKFDLGLSEKAKDLNSPSKSKVLQRKHIITPLNLNHLNSTGSKNKLEGVGYDNIAPGSSIHPSSTAANTYGQAVLHQVDQEDALHSPKLEGNLIKKSDHEHLIPKRSSNETGSEEYVKAISNKPQITVEKDTLQATPPISLRLPIRQLSEMEKASGAKNDIPTYSLMSPTSKGMRLRSSYGKSIIVGDSLRAAKEAQSIMDKFVVL